MEEKKKLKFSLVGVLLLVAIIVIAVLGYMLYTNNTKTVELSSNEKELNAKIEQLEKELDKQKAIEEEKKAEEEKEPEEANEDTEQTEQTLNIEMVKGAYEYVPNDEEFSAIYLLGDGSFFYNTDLRTNIGYSGYYTFDNDGKITLHCIMDCANDIGSTITDKTMTVYLENNKIVDKELGREYEKIDRAPEECVEFYPNIISSHLKASLEAGALH